MANKIKVKQILELRSAGVSQRLIAQTRHIARQSISDVYRIANERGIQYSDIESLSDEEVYALFFPHKHNDVSMLYETPDYSNVHTELKRVGVTLKLL